MPCEISLTLKTVSFTKDHWSSNISNSSPIFISALKNTGLGLPASFQELHAFDIKFCHIRYLPTTLCTTPCTTPYDVWREIMLCQCAIRTPFSPNYHPTQILLLNQFLRVIFMHQVFHCHSNLFILNFFQSINWVKPLPSSSVQSVMQG